MFDTFKVVQTRSYSPTQLPVTQHQSCLSAQHSEYHSEQEHLPCRAFATSACSTPCAKAPKGILCPGHDVWHLCDLCAMEGG